MWNRGGLYGFRGTGAVVTGLLLGFMLVLAGCNIGGAGAPAGKSNADLLKEAADNMRAAKSYHMSADFTQGDQQVKYEGDIDLANKNMKLDLTSSGQNISMIQIGQDSYLSLDGGATYTKAPEGSAADLTGIAEIWSSFSDEDVDKAKDALKDGTPPTETIDGTQTKHITANAKDLQSLKTSSSSVDSGTVDIWITTDSKPTVRQMKFDGTSDGKPLKGTFKWTKINEQFKIEPPPQSERVQPAGIAVVVAVSFRLS